MDQSRLDNEFLLESVLKNSSAQKSQLNQKDDLKANFKQFRQEHMSQNLSTTNNQQQFIVHHFTINLQQVKNLLLPSDWDGQVMMIQFNYPTNKQKISSYPFIYQEGTKNYNLISNSSFTFIQRQERNAQAIDFVDSIEGGIKFSLKTQEQIVAASIFASQELADIIDTTDIYTGKIDKVSLTFNKCLNVAILFGNSLNHAKLHFELIYQARLMNQYQITQDKELLELHNKTQVQIQIPKKVYFYINVNFSINKRLKTNKLIQLIFMNIDLISSYQVKNPGLENINEHIYLDEKDSIQIEKEFKIDVTEDFINHLQNNSVNFNFFSSQGEDQIKQKLGEHILPMNDLLLNDAGITKEKAITNYKGLYVGLLKVKCQLNKYQSLKKEKIITQPQKYEQKKTTEVQKNLDFANEIWEKPEIINNFAKTIAEIQTMSYNKRQINEDEDLERIRRIIQGM